MAHNTPWTRIDLQTLTEMVIAGRTNSYIASYLGRTIAAIQAARARPEVQAAIVGKSGYAPTPLVKAPAPVVKKTPARKGQRWTESEDGELIYGFALGQTPEQLADELNRTVSGVLGRLKEFGLLEFDKDEMAYFVPRKLYRKVS